MQEVKVGQVWRAKVDHGFDFKIVACSKRTAIVEANFANQGGPIELTRDLRWVDSMCFLVSDSPATALVLSDLDIAQKALLKVECSLDIDRRGGWWVGDGKGKHNNFSYSGKSMQELLTWAKQTIGVE